MCLAKFDKKANAASPNWFVYAMAGKMCLTEDLDAAVTAGTAILFGGSLPLPVIHVAPTHTTNEWPCTDAAGNSLGNLKLDANDAT